MIAGYCLSPFDCGIYAIENMINGWVYIGSGSPIKARWRGHRRDLEHNKHVNKKLQADWNLYSADAFVFKVLEIIPFSLDRAPLRWREQQLISAATAPLYNVAPAMTEQTHQRYINGNAAGLSYNTVRPMWLNTARRADLDTIDRLSRVLQVAPGDLLVRVEERTETP